MRGLRKEKIYTSIEECPPEYSGGRVPNRFIDIKGKQYGHLKVLYMVWSYNKRTEWLCKCLNCGNYVIVNSHNLRSGHTQSCGCLVSQNLRQDLTGKTFNNLKVISYDKSVNENPYWRVKCLKCGRKYSVDGYALKKQFSCGCVKSPGETKIADILLKSGIDFKQQFTFEDLHGVGGNKLRFDFAIYQDGVLSHLVEMQGVQHYYNVFNIDSDKYNKQLERDKKKREYCAEHDIPLIEIKYDEDIALEKLLVFRTKGIVAEDFIQYRKPSLFVSNSVCDWFKCDKENGEQLCINSHLVKSKTLAITYDRIIQMYLDNPITESVVFGGLENFDEFEQLRRFIECFRKYSKDDVIVYTGYNKSEIEEKISTLAQYPNILVKYGRFRPNKEKHYDSILGVELASDNQYAERIS